jgi:hypothetical protein
VSLLLLSFSFHILFLVHIICSFIPIHKIVFFSFPQFQSCDFLEQPMNPAVLSFPAVDSFVLFFLIQTIQSILLLFPNNSCPPIFILGSKVGLNRTDSLGTAIVVIRVLSRWYSSTRQCSSTTVAALHCTVHPLVTVYSILYY